MSELKAVALDDPRLSVRGALHVERSADRLRFHRLPNAMRQLSPEPAFDLMAAMTSGVRLVFETTSRVLEVDALETGLQFAGEPRRPARLDLICGAATASLDLSQGHTIVVDGPKVNFVPGFPAKACFDLPPGLKIVELWLPQSAMTEIRGLSIEADSDISAPPPPTRTWGHYGSSISHGMEAEGPSRTWPAIAARTLGYELSNLGFAGQCHLDSFVARALRGGGFDVISMEIGVNIVASDTMRRRTFASAVDGFLDTIRDTQPKTPMTLISPIYSSLVETMSGPVLRKPHAQYERQERPFAAQDGALTLQGAREIIQSVVVRRRSNGDENIFYIDGLCLFGPDDADLMPDQLHPNEEGHALLAQRFCKWARPTVAFGAQS